MKEATLEINGTKHGFGAVWVHLQEVACTNSYPYRIIVSATIANQVFDPYNTREPSQSMPSFIKMMVRDLGTFIVEAYINKIASILGTRKEAYEWVLASVDDVMETSGWIEIVGRIVPFARERI